MTNLRVLMILLVLAACFVGLIFLQIFLSRKRRRLPVLSFLLSLVLLCNVAYDPSRGVGQMVGVCLATFVLGNLSTVIFLVVYFVCREKLRRDLQLEKMRVQDL